MIVSLSELLPQAAENGTIVPNFNIFGVDEAYAVTEAAEELGFPIILATNKDMVNRFTTEILGPSLRRIAERASIPVCLHLDHTYELSKVYRAVYDGYSSVMFDGSQLPVEENCARTAQVVEVAHSCGVSVEGEVGSVPYPEPDSVIKDELSDPDEVFLLSQTGLDALAVSIGNKHRLVEQTSGLRFDLLEAIESRVRTPLVIHGASGITDQEMRRLRRSRVAKVNIGTALRMAFGNGLRAELESSPGAFDRLQLMDCPLADLAAAAKRKILLLQG